MKNNPGPPSCIHPRGGIEATPWDGSLSLDKSKTNVNTFRRHIIFLSFIAIIFIFFSPFFLKGLLPIPADTIIGLYHPFRDLYANDYPNGIPFKNFLITDPVRQIIPWKKLATDQLLKSQFPLWNPYEMAGMPLLGNFQSSPFYPLNALLLLKPFYAPWSVFILLQFLGAGFFLYLYLRNLNLDRRAALLGTLSFCFSGFFIAWLEWGTVVHVALWLPLVLLSIDKMFSSFIPAKNLNLKTQDSKPPFDFTQDKQLKTPDHIIWSAILVFALTPALFAA